MDSLFHRGSSLIEIDDADGVWLRDTSGRTYLDAASGAFVVNVGHGDAQVIATANAQAKRVSYVHAASFTTRAAEQYAANLSARLPMDDASVYPVSGGSEATETAMKVARAYHLANGDKSRTRIVGRTLSYHGNTRGALDVSDRSSLRQPYLPWLGLAGRVPAPIEYRCPNPDHPKACDRWHADQLHAEIVRLGPENVAAFIAEPIGGAASGAAVPPDGYWTKMAEVCRRHGVLIIADEVMTGFGRTGQWFASEHFSLRPDIITLAKGASSGYWPLGVCAFSSRVYETIATGGGLVHGFTFSHHPVGAAVGNAVISRIEELGLVEAAAAKGRVLLAGLIDSLDNHPYVADIRGKGLLVAIELVEDQPMKTPFPRSRRVAEQVAQVARELGLVIYPSSGCANGYDGDLVLIGPPLIVSDEEIHTTIGLMAKTLERTP